MNKKVRGMVIAVGFAVALATGAAGVASMNLTFNKEKPAKSTP